MSALRSGQAASLVRRLTGPVVARDLHSALIADGKGTPPLFIQRTGGPAVIVEAAAVKAVCRGQEVVLDALTEGGRVALAAIAAVLGAHVAEQSEDRIVARFERCDAPEEYDRAHAKTPFDVLRALAFGQLPSDRDEPFALLAA